MIKRINLNNKIYDYINAQLKNINKWYNLNLIYKIYKFLFLDDVYISERNTLKAVFLKKWLYYFRLSIVF